MVQNYNNSRHETIQNVPSIIHNPNRLNEKQINLVDKRIENFAKNSKELHLIDIHQKVRLHILTRSANRRDKLFAKKYHPQWSAEIYEVVRRLHINNPLKRTKYKVKMIKNKDGNDVNIEFNKRSSPEGKFYYRRDLQVIDL